MLKSYKNRVRGKFSAFWKPHQNCEFAYCESKKVIDHITDLVICKTDTTLFQKRTSQAWRVILYLKQISMKKLILSIIIITALFGCDSNKSVSKQNKAYDINLSALELVNKRMEFYNLHDFEKFIQLYDNNVKIYTYPDKLLGTGTDNISSIFQPKFASKSIQVKIVSQMNNGNYIINHEIVTENGIDTKYVSIYEVKDGLIKSVKFVRDN